MPEAQKPCSPSLHIHNWGVFHTENGAVFNASDLARFAAVVFLNASGDVLDEAQEHAFQAWLEAGGGWLGIHSAGDDSHLAWQWYRDNLIGATFIAHPMNPQFQRATVVLENNTTPSCVVYRISGSMKRNGTPGRKVRAPRASPFSPPSMKTPIRRCRSLWVRNGTCTWVITRSYGVTVSGRVAVSTLPWATRRKPLSSRRFDC